MERLTKQSNKNSPAEYDRIFKERAKKGPSWQDVRRWKELFSKYKKGILLDMGCLDSGIIELISQRADYIGIDLAEESLREMSKHYPEGRFLKINLYNTDFSTNGWISYVVLGEVLEHLDRPADAIKEALRILKPGGILAISVPLEEAKEPGAIDKDRHLWSFTKQDIWDLVMPYSNLIKSNVLRSKWFPRYKYCWPTLVVWAWKK